MVKQDEYARQCDGRLWFAAGGSFNKSKINADHESVNEQAGIYAGDEGYDINVNKHTDLKGALITSTQRSRS